METLLAISYLVIWLPRFLTYDKKYNFKWVFLVCFFDSLWNYIKLYLDCSLIRYILATVRSLYYLFLIFKEDYFIFKEEMTSW